MKGEGMIKIEIAQLLHEQVEYDPTDAIKTMEKGDYGPVCRIIGLTADSLVKRMENFNKYLKRSTAVLRALREGQSQ